MTFMLVEVQLVARTSKQMIQCVTGEARYSHFLFFSIQRVPAYRFEKKSETTAVLFNLKTSKSALKAQGEKKTKTTTIFQQVRLHQARHRF